MISMFGTITPPPPKKRELELAEKIMQAAHSETSLTYLWCCLSVEMDKVRKILAAEKPMGEVVYDGWMNKHPGCLPLLYDGADRAKSMLGMTGKTIRVRVYAVPEGAP